MYILVSNRAIWIKVKFALINYNIFNLSSNDMLKQDFKLKVLNSVKIKAFKKISLVLSF